MSSDDNLFARFSDVDSLCPLKKSLSILEPAFDGCKFESDKIHTFIVFGASGQLASRKIYPTFWQLYRNSLLPRNTFIVGYARTPLTVQNLQERSQLYSDVKSGEDDVYANFWECNSYVKGHYDVEDDFKSLNDFLKEKERQTPSIRIFYIALPTNVIANVLVNIKNNCTRMANGAPITVRVIFEKPFGRDLQSSDNLTNQINGLFSEQEIFRIDRQLAHELIQHVVALRFSNALFTSIWDRTNIAAVLICCKQKEMLHGTGGYFDKQGIIRDIMLTYLIQILTFFAMEKPASCLPEDIRDERLRVLKRIKPMRLRDVVLGQYVGNPRGTQLEKLGYLDDITVPKNSSTSTFVLARIRIENDRWEGVPFILICGKALNEQKTEVRVQFYPSPGDIFGNQTRNEVVVSMEPTPRIYMAILMKSPGFGFVLDENQIDIVNLNVDSTTLSAYERILVDVICGSHFHCIRSDELHETWRILSPLLRQVEEDRIKPMPYYSGSPGPREAEAVLRYHNFHPK